MVEDTRIRPKGCISEPSSGISPNWNDMRSEFGYTTLGEMLIPGFINLMAA
jgi:hypothetical protein